MTNSRGVRNIAPWLLATACVVSINAAEAQDRVSMEQVQVRTATRATATTARPGIQESDYLLRSEAGPMLLMPSQFAGSVPGLPDGPTTSRARVQQSGYGNTSTIDMTGVGNTAFQNVVGAQNTVTQVQTGNLNSSNVNVVGDANTIGTRQESNGAAAAITVQGNNNAISAQQQGNSPVAISITQIGNGGNVAVSRR